MNIYSLDDIEMPELKVGETYELWPGIQLIVLTEDTMIIVAPFGMIDVHKDELLGLWVS